MKCIFHSLDDAKYMAALGRLSDFHIEVMPVCAWCADALSKCVTYSMDGKVYSFDEYDEREL